MFLFISYRILKDDMNFWISKTDCRLVCIIFKHTVLNLKSQAFVQLFFYIDVLTLYLYMTCWDLIIIYKQLFWVWNELTVLLPLFPNIRRDYVFILKGLVYIDRICFIKKTTHNERTEHRYCFFFYFRYINMWKQYIIIWNSRS